MKGPIAFMADNHVAANILMMIFIVGGLIIGGSIKQEVFPEFEMDMVTITVVYPGATPEEVEDAIVRPIELAISGINNIKQINAIARENVGTVNIEVIEGADADLVLQDAKSEVDRILTFPEEAEKPVITKVVNKREVITAIVYGDAGERALLEHAERTRDDLLANSNITQVEISGYRPYEISIEISENNLRKYNLRLTDVAQAVRRASLDLAGGTIRTEGGDVMIRTIEKRYTGFEFDSVAVRTLPNGQRILLRDIAEVHDAFEEVDQEALMDGKPAIMINVFRVGDQTPKEISQIVRDYIDTHQQDLPPSVQLAVWNDWSVILQQRIELLLDNSALGLFLVLLTLSLFLELRLAIMVALGIAISFLGSLMLMPSFNASINMISLFAFLVILGIVVDDAIVVGENIFVHKRNKNPLAAAIDGTKEVSNAVIFAGLTTIAAFSPLLFAGGFLGKFMGVLPKIVISVLIISLIEALFILPSHLNSKFVDKKAWLWDAVENKRKKVDRLLDWLVNVSYVKTLFWAFKNRYVTIALAIAILFVSLGFITSGILKVVMMPQVESDIITVNLQMPAGTPYNETKLWAQKIGIEGDELVKKYDALRTDGISNLEHVYTLVGQQLIMTGPHMGTSVPGSNLAQIYLRFKEADVRNIQAKDFADEWREKVGEIPGVESLSFSSDLIGSGKDMEIQFSHTNFNQLLAAVERVEKSLSEYAGVTEVSDNYTEGKREWKIRMRPEAASLGLTETDLAMQVRAAFYGAEAMRIQRGQNEVKVMVRYPEADRRTLATVDHMRIRTPQGKEIPLRQAAFIEEGRGYSEINRTDRRRVITVAVKLNKKTTSSDDILADLKSGLLRQLVIDYPGLSYDLEGTSQDQRESLQSLIKAFIFGLIIIYALLAVLFRSFLQPFLVMSAIPFGVVGAIGGHVLLGYDISMISIFGIVALTGVVVNSSLVMIDFINKNRRKNLSIRDAVMEAGLRRFRPIIMTALTTFFGLMPMIMETNIQAQFLVPMAISLGFGVLFATGVTLVLVPTLYMILEDFKSIAKGGHQGDESEFNSEIMETVD